MFERYTEKARRVIFFARYESSHYGSARIETEYLLLGLLREDKALTNRFLVNHASVEAIRRQIESQISIHEKISTSVDLPLSNECKRVLAYAAEEALRFDHQHIGTEHLLLGLLRESPSFAARLLNERNIFLDDVRAFLRADPPEASAQSASLHDRPSRALIVRVIESETRAALYSWEHLSPAPLPRIGEVIELASPDGPPCGCRIQDLTWTFPPGDASAPQTITLIVTGFPSL